MNEIINILKPEFFLNFLIGPSNYVFFFVFLLGLSKVFIKAGISWWYAFIPVINILYLCKVARASLMWGVLAILPFLTLMVLMLMMMVGAFNSWMIFLIAGAFFAITLLLGFIATIKIAFGVAKGFGKGTGFALGLVIFPWLFYGILGFGKAEYHEDDEVSPVNQNPQTPQASITTTEKIQ